MSFKHWHWIDDILLPLAVLGLRLCWLWPWLELLRRWITPHIQTPFLAFPALVILGAGGYIMAHQTLRTGAISRAARAWVIGLGLGAVFIAVWVQHVAPAYAVWDGRAFALLVQQATDWSLGPPPAFVGLVVGVGLWVQGVRDATPLSRHEQIWSTFTTGFVAFVLMILLIQLDEQGLPPGTGAAIWIFFGVGMAALALSALEYAGLGQDKETAAPGMSRYWLGSMLAVVGGILGIGLVLALALAPGTVAAALGSLRFLVDWLGAILGVILVVLAYITFLLVEPIYNYLRQFMELPEPEEETIDTQSLNQMLETFGEDPNRILPPAVTESLPWVALLLTALALAIAVTIALRILRRTPQESYVETRESVFSADLLQEQLSSLWRRFTGQDKVAPIDPFLSLAGEEERRQIVRAIYQEFLAQMQTLGHPRAPELTPATYGAQLHARRAFHPGEAADVAPGETAEQTVEQAVVPGEDAASQMGTLATVETLTAGYVQARYGDTAPTPEQVAAVQAAWARLQAVFAVPPAPTGDARADADRAGTTPGKNDAPTAG